MHSVQTPYHRATNTSRCPQWPGHLSTVAGGLSGGCCGEFQSNSTPRFLISLAAKESFASRNNFTICSTPQPLYQRKWRNARARPARTSPSSPHSSRPCRNRGTALLRPNSGVRRPQVRPLLHPGKHLRNPPTMPVLMSNSTGRPRPSHAHFAVESCVDCQLTVNHNLFARSCARAGSDALRTDRITDVEFGAAPKLPPRSAPGCVASG